MASKIALIAIIVVGVLAVSALLGWAMLRLAISTERAQRDPEYRRRLALRHLVFQCVACSAGAVVCVVQVATRQAPLQIISMLGVLMAQSISGSAKGDKASAFRR